MDQKRANMENRIFTLNVCKCEENIKNVSVGSIFNEKQSHNCLHHGYYQNYNEITIEIDKNNKVLWSTI